MDKNDHNSNISYSMYVDSDNNFSIVNKDQLTRVQRRGIQTWIEDDAVNQCYNCLVEFTWYIRRHHCRSCGRIFCSECSTKRTKLPNDIENFPKAPDQYQIKTLWNNILYQDGAEKVRVCDKCYLKIKQLEELYNLISVFSLISLEIKTVKLLTMVEDAPYEI